MRTKTRLIAATLLLLPALTFAAPGGRGDGDGQRRQGPPQEALDACPSQSEGGSCSFESPHGNIDGTCRQVRNGDIACVPEGHGRPGKDQRPDTDEL